MFRILLSAAALAIIGIGMSPEPAQADPCVVCNAGPNPLDPDETLHRITGTGGEHECSGGGGHATHNCGGDETGEYWPGDCGDHASCEGSYAMATEAVESFEAGSVQLATLVMDFGSHVLVDEKAGKLMLFGCDGAVARTIRLSTIAASATPKRTAG